MVACSDRGMDERFAREPTLGGIPDGLLRALLAFIYATDAGQRRVGSWLGAACLENCSPAKAS